MKNIAVLHISNIKNYGSSMMAVNLITYLNRKFPNSTFYVDNFKQQELSGLKIQSGIDNIESIYESKPGIKNKLDIIKNTTNMAKIVKDKNIDAVIIVGGDDISEYYGVKLLLLGIFEKYLISKKSPVILAGQSLGPFNSWRIPFMKKALKNFTVISRDQDCYDYVTNDLNNECFNSRDLAFLDLPMQKEQNLEKFKYLNKYNLVNKEYITVVASGLWQSYTDNYESYLNNQISTIKKLVLKGNNIVLLAHVLAPDHVSDVHVINDIVKKLSTEDMQKVTIITEEMTPLQARMILGQGKLTITGRMHAAVSTFQMNKPAISLSYSVKYAGVIGKGLNMQELVVDSDIKNNKHKWDQEKIVDEILEKVEYITTNYDEIQKTIKINIQKSAELATQSLEYIVEQI